MCEAAEKCAGATVGDIGEAKSDEGAIAGTAPALKGPMLTGMFGMETRNGPPLLELEVRVVADEMDAEERSVTCDGFTPVEIPEPALVLLRLRLRGDPTGRDVTSLRIDLEDLRRRDGLSLSTESASSDGRLSRVREGDCWLR